jgi:SAM-dependent methyltransferase
MNKTQKMVKILSCPKCQGNFSRHNGSISCDRCQSSFNIEKEKIVLIPFNDYTPEENDKIIFRVKQQLKKFPRMYKVLCYLTAPIVGLSAYQFARRFSIDQTVINVGSGTKIIRPDIINLDIYPYNNVDIVADAGVLPINSDSADAIICESLIEHINDPELLVGELFRVLKKDGGIYLVAPFIQSFHSSPNDFQRWTDQGLIALLAKKGFQKIKAGVLYGPTSSLINIFAEWLAILVSFNSQFLHDLIFLIINSILFPIKLIDFALAKFNTAKNSALGFYIVAKK